METQARGTEIRGEIRSPFDVETWVKPAITTPIWGENADGGRTESPPRRGPRSWEE
jgi:hypothetical protein